MFDHSEEDKDLESQVQKGPASEEGMARGEREGTPGPTPTTPNTSGSTTSKTTESPSSISTETSETPTAKVKAIVESALPDKLTSPTGAK
jgi:hypothetical protein